MFTLPLSLAYPFSLIHTHRRWKVFCFYLSFLHDQYEMSNRESGMHKFYFINTVIVVTLKFHYVNWFDGDCVKKEGIKLLNKMLIFTLKSASVKTRHVPSHQSSVYFLYLSYFINFCFILNA